MTDSYHVYDSDAPNSMRVVEVFISPHQGLTSVRLMNTAGDVTVNTCVVPEHVDGNTYALRYTVSVKAPGDPTAKEFSIYVADAFRLLELQDLLTTEPGSDSLCTPVEIRVTPDSLIGNGDGTTSAAGRALFTMSKDIIELRHAVGRQYESR